MAGIDEIGRLIETVNSLRSNIGTKPRQKWYVDQTNGGANFDGLSRISAFSTIGAAVNAAAAGDIIHIAEDTYDEAISIPAGKTGLQVVCEPGVYLINTTPGTVVAIAAAVVYWEGGIIETNGQTGMEINGQWFTGKDIRVYNCNIGFDMNSDHPLLINCRTNETAASGFDISEDSGYYINCACHGVAASRGFYLSHTNAHNNIFKKCSTLGCTAAGYETVAGADENLFSFCSQSSLCAGPTDAGANNTWAHHVEDSQITAGNTVQEDLSGVYTRMGAPAGASVSADVAIIDGIVDNILLDTQIRVIQSGAQAILAAATEWLHIDSGTNGAEILSIAIAGINGHDWTLATYVPSADAVAAPAADDKRDTIAYLAADTEGGLLKPFAIPFNCYLQFTNDGANDDIDQVTITYRSRGVLTLTWGP